MLQDIAPHTYHVEFTPAEPQPADLLLIYGPQGVLSAADALRLPRRADFPDIAVHFAFRLDDRAVFLAREPVEAPEGWRYVPSVTYRDAEPRETAFACATGESLQRWYAANRFCGRCGALMTENPAERAMTCPVCHKKMELRGKGDSQIFVCKCGYKEKLSSFKDRRAKEGAGVSKKDVAKYLNQQSKETEEPLNDAFARMLAGIKLDQ